MRTETRADSRLFGGLLRALLREGISVRFEAQGRSMYPAIADGDTVQVNPDLDCSKPGDVALVETADGFRVHRVIASTNPPATRGDCCLESDCDVHTLAGTVSLVGFHEAKPVPRQRAGTIIRRWIALFRGHF